MKPLSAPNLFLDRLWKEKQAKQHRRNISNITSEYSQGLLNKSRRPQVLTNGGKKDHMFDGK